MLTNYTNTPNVLEQAERIELSSSDWKSEIITIIPYLHNSFYFRRETTREFKIMKKYLISEDPKLEKELQRLKIVVIDYYKTSPR